MSQFTDLDMLYDYEKDAAIAAMGYMTLATRAHHGDLRNIYLKLANEATNSHSKVSKLISQSGGIA
ncbi:Coat F domain-containing protein [Candidatus Desulfosporosinus infrequens]|uniref:Coat F domain-containing protein n=1 Tax=Candidatus Desulfosporosinus infrequens TaxID=2043169 RepID=A0A2U3LUY5_9FIRM|nr:Coat F domain-containing protein [Candidatus Desulfosporosinus infrequens]